MEQWVFDIRKKVGKGYTLFETRGDDGSVSFIVEGESEVGCLRNFVTARFAWIQDVSII